MTRIVAGLQAAAFAFAALAAGSAAAQDYPARPIRIIVPLAAGGLSDMFARTVAKTMGEATNQTIVVENRTGGGGTIGAEAAAKAAPDGYTFFMGSHGTLAIQPHLNRKLPYDPARDFVPVIQITALPNLLVVHPSVPARSVAELVAHAKANPGRVSYASQGNGSSGHMAGEQFRQIAGIDIVHVPYRGAALAVQDLVAGHVNIMFDSVTLQMPHIQAGQTRALAVSSSQRVAVLPDVPTTIEAGLPQLQGGAWFGLLAPTGTPPAAIAWANAQARKAFDHPGTRKRFLAQGALLPLGTSDEFAALIAAERERWGEVIRRGKISLDVTK